MGLYTKLLEGVRLDMCVVVGVKLMVLVVVGVVGMLVVVVGMLLLLAVVAVVVVYCSGVCIGNDMWTRCAGGVTIACLVVVVGMYASFSLHQYIVSVCF
jgi:hypothetical protein